METLEVLDSGSLAVASSSPGLVRHLAFQGDGYLVLRSRSEPGVASGWHHHGAYHVLGYLASGQARLESENSETGTVSLAPGDFFHVPPGTVHREINPSQDEANEFILFLRGTGPLVVNVDEEAHG